MASPDVTQTSIPNLDELRAIKGLYPGIPIDVTNRFFSEPVVSLNDYGISGTSYYSGPNKATGQPLPGIKPEPLVRRSVAEKLTNVKERLWNNEQLARHVGGRAELTIKDALWSLGLQKHLFEVVWPEILREANSEWDEVRIAEELPKVVAKPNNSLLSPTPHMTGGAVDVDLVREDGEKLDFGHLRGNVVVSQTDYHEGRATAVERAPINPFARVVRRALYWSMLEQGFSNHPYEFWHYSYGDQMWAMFSGQQVAIYGAVEGTPDLQ